MITKNKIREAFLLCVGLVTISASGFFMSVDLYPENHYMMIEDISSHESMRLKPDSLQKIRNNNINSAYCDSVLLVYRGNHNIDSMNLETTSLSKRPRKNIVSLLRDDQKRTWKETSLDTKK